MTTSQLVGTIRDTAGNGITGKLTIKLNAPIIDVTPSPDAVNYMKPVTYSITSGNLNAANVNLLKNDECTYNFSFTYNQNTLILYLNGSEYTGFYHIHTDSNYYTGEIHDGSSQLLTPYQRAVTVSLFDPFDAHVLTSFGSTFEWSSLVPSNVNASNIDTSLYYIAQLITQTSALLQSLVQGIYNPRGNYNNSTLYSKGDVVFDAGTLGSYWYIYPTPSTGIPLSNTTYWQLLITSTEVTGGAVDFSPVFMNDAFGGSWDGVVNKAPNADVLYDKLLTLASLNDATFVSLKAPTKSVGTNTTDVATMAALNQALAAYSPPATTTAANLTVDDVTNKIVNARTLKNMINRIAVAEERQSQGSNGGAITGGFKNRNMNTLVSNTNGASSGITGGYIQVPAGKYWVEGWSIVCGVDRNRPVLVDSAGNFLLLGESAETGNRTYQITYRGNSRADIKGYLEVAAFTNLTIRHYAETTGTATDSGKACSYAGSEIFAQLAIWKLE